MACIKTTLLLAALTVLFVAFGYGLGGLWGGTAALALAGAVNAWTWFRGGDAILAAHGAREADPADDWDLLELVRATAARAGLPAPRVFLTDCRQANAFAVHRGPDDAALVLSGGLPRRLTRDELAAVIGHELGHVWARDSLLATIAATIVGAVVAVGAILALVGWGTRRNGGWPLLALGIAAPLAAVILAFALSREREFAADRFSAERCVGGPRPLISALRKLAPAAERHQNTPALAHPATAALFFVDPVPRLPLGWLFASHPPVSARIRRLEWIAQEGEGRSV